MKKKHQFWREAAPAPPPGRHLGHYKALLAPVPAKQGREEAGSWKATIWNIHFRMMQLAMPSGCACKRWRHTAACMLEKGPGRPRAHRLRVIHQIGRAHV